MVSSFSLDTKNKIKSLHEIFMFEPFKKHKTNMAKITVVLQNLNVNINVYSNEVAEECVKYKRPPRCVFLPDKMVFRQLIKAVCKKDKNECDEHFFLKLGLLVEPSEYKNVKELDKVQIMHKDGHIMRESDI